jgi:hypothetical protein
LFSPDGCRATGNESPVTYEVAEKIDSGEAPYACATAPGERLCLSRSPGYLQKEIFVSYDSEIWYDLLTVQAGTPMTVKEIGPTSVTRWVFSFII